MADLLSDKQYKEIMTTIKKKVNIFKNKLQKIKQKKFSRDKVPNNQETGKKNFDIYKKKENKQSGKIKKGEKSIKRKSLQKSKRICRTKMLST